MSNQNGGGKPPFPTTSMLPGSWSMMTPASSVIANSTQPSLPAFIRFLPGALKQLIEFRQILSLLRSRLMTSRTL